MESNKSDDAAPEATAPKAGWRVKIGFTLFIASTIWPVLLPILPLFGLSGQAVAKFTGIMFVVGRSVDGNCRGHRRQRGLRLHQTANFRIHQILRPAAKVGVGRYKPAWSSYDAAGVCVPDTLHREIHPRIGRIWPGVRHCGGHHAAGRPVPARRRISGKSCAPCLSIKPLPSYQTNRRNNLRSY